MSIVHAQSAVIAAAPAPDIAFYIMVAGILETDPNYPSTARGFSQLQGSSNGSLDPLTGRVFDGGPTLFDIWTETNAGNFFRLTLFDPLVDALWFDRLRVRATLGPNEVYDYTLDVNDAGSIEIDASTRQWTWNRDFTGTPIFVVTHTNELTFIKDPP